MNRSSYNCSYFLADYLSYRSYLGLVVLLVSLFLLFFGWKFVRVHKSKTGVLGILFVFVGSVLNLLERMRNGGCVHDYLNFFGLFLFNFYDLLIDLGIILVIISYVRQSNSENKNSI